MKLLASLFLISLVAVGPVAGAVRADDDVASQLQAIRAQKDQYTTQQGGLLQDAQHSEQGLKDAQAQLAKQQAVVAASQQKIEATNRKLIAVKKQRSLVMQQAYVTGGDNSTLHALLGSSSLSEFLSKNQYTAFLARKKFADVNDIDSLIGDLDHQRLDLVTKKNALEAQSAYLQQQIASIQNELATNKANLAAAAAFEQSLTSRVGLFAQNERPFLHNNEPVGDLITFEGSGTEHGLGMSQYGAKGFAEHGMNYRDILSHYYPGTQLSTIGNFATNYGDSEEYLVRVVSGEVSASWPAETLKAQAIAARSYVNKNPMGQDCTPRTQACAAPNEAARAAVAATRGQVLTYNGDVIQAYFHSTSGGWTENNENVWGGTPIPWLRGVASPYETDSPHWDWKTKSYTKQEMADILNKDDRTAVGALQTIKIVGRGVSGRVTSMQIIGSSGTKTVSGPAFKSVFNNNSPADEDGLQDTLFGFI